ncbi:piwi-like protein Ago3 [Daphnia pulex]|uniref:piwi-like protein Ago3 n=1 Tax=Daphnia pulex TaxID=6669 RepID=UPI001EDE5EDE|nr:piwi-like protein Ago3 [Daphnia pulex]
MSEQGSIGRGRIAAGGRGAQLLAALEANRRPGQPSVPVEPPADPTLPSAAAALSDVSAAKAPVGRGSAMVQLLARRRVMGSSASPEVGASASSVQSPTQSSSIVSPSISNPSSPSVISQISVESATQVTTIVGNLNPVGRGIVARMRSLEVSSTTVKEAVKSVAQERPKMQPKSEEVYPKPILTHQENAPIVKKGEMGNRIDVVANYVRVNIDPGKGIYEYEVSFFPLCDSKEVRFQLLNQHRETLGPAKTFDGVTLYLPYQFENTVTSFQSMHPATNEPVEVKLTLRQKRRAADSIHFYNVLIRKIARILGMVQINRNYFNPSSPIFMPAEKLEVWPGYVTAINEFEDGLMLCCDVSFRVLRTTTVRDELVEMSKKGGYFHQTAQDVLIGLSVLTRYNNKMYRIDEILFDKNPSSIFDCQGEPMSYVDYYKKQYNIDIQDKGQPMLLNRLKKKMQGKEDETVLVCLVPELCFLTGLDDRLRSNFTIMRSLATHTKVAPMARVKALTDYIQSVNNNERAKSVLSEWGLSLAPMPLSLEGRVIEPEKIFLSKSNFTTNPQCDWSRNLGNDILVAVKIETWILVYTDRNLNNANDFSKTLMEVGSKMGIRIKPPKMVGLPNDRTDTYVNRIRDEINSSLQLVVAIFPTSRDDRYAAVKTLCTAQYAIPSQMMNSKTISNPSKLRSIVQKIALQINCKMGGELWAVSIPTKTLMVCGVDVYHDPTKRGQSVVGFVASVNPGLTRWFSRAKYQGPGVELVDTLKICFLESLKKYYELNQDYPKQIVLFRDGVGDGQLQFAAAHEAAQFLSAFQALSPPFEPKFTMVVVQKRINTRLFHNSRGAINNPPPGTVVDHTVTRRDWWDFFLVSQFVTQGTVSPTHFIVVHDGGMKPDNLQKLAYKMTHMYYNWPGTIRVPAPCQYAHKLAYLVGESIRKEPQLELSNRLYFL